MWAWHVQDIDRKNEQTAAILKRQADQIIELEALYKEEQVLRKRYFNMMEGVSSFLVPFVSPCVVSTRICCCVSCQGCGYLYFHVHEINDSLTTNSFYFPVFSEMRISLKRQMLFWMQRKHKMLFLCGQLKFE